MKHRCLRSRGAEGSGTSLEGSEGVCEVEDAGAATVNGEFGVVVEEITSCWSLLFELFDDENFKSQTGKYPLIYFGKNFRIYRCGVVGEVGCVFLSGDQGKAEAAAEVLNNLGECDDPVILVGTHVNANATTWRWCRRIW
ncbi:hypothetical protein ACFX2C_021781 [Malus domestica]